MLKNYTSEVPATTSINKIENKLVVSGAKNISKVYTDQKLAGICFTMPIEGKDLSFRLPSRMENVERILKSQIKRPKPTTYARIAKQAERTAWKLLSDWVDIQMSLIELQQVEFAEVFLSYVYDHANEETYYDKIKKGNFKQLTCSGGK